MKASLIFVKNRIRILRKERKMTQEQLADLCETSLRNIQYLEKGERGIMEWIEPLSRALECEPWEIIADPEQVREKVLTEQEKKWLSLLGVLEQEKFEDMLGFFKGKD